MGEFHGGIEGLCSGEAAGVDGVVLYGEAGAWGNGGRGREKEEMERGGGIGGGIT